MSQIPLRVSFTKQDKKVELDLRQYEVERVDSNDDWKTVTFTFKHI